MFLCVFMFLRRLYFCAASCEINDDDLGLHQLIELEKRLENAPQVEYSRSKFKIFFGERHSHLPDPSSVGRGYPSCPHISPPRRRRRLDVRACGARPPPANVAHHCLCGSFGNEAHLLQSCLVSCLPASPVAHSWTQRAPSSVRGRSSTHA